MLLKYGDNTVKWMEEGYLTEKQLQYFDTWIGEMSTEFIADWASMKKVARFVYLFILFKILLFPFLVRFIRCH